MSGIGSDKGDRSENSPYPYLASARKQIVIFGAVITLALVADVIVSWLFDIASANVQGTIFGVALFVAALAAVHGVGVYVLISFVQRITKRIREGNQLYSIMFWFVVVAEVVAICLLISVALEILLYRSYHQVTAISAVALSMAGAAAVLALQGYSFLTWFRVHTKNLVIAVYALAPILASIGVGLGVFRSLLRLVEGPVVIRSDDRIVFQLTGTFGPYQELYYLTVLTLLVSYGFFWIGSILHLKSFLRKKGRLNYWLLAFVPAIVFPTTLAISIGAESSAMASDLERADAVAGALVFRLTAIASALASFIMNAAVYFVMSRKVTARSDDQSESMRIYLILAGLGVMTLGIAIAVPTFSMYPPFESIPRSFMALAAYLYSIGLYSSAISLAEDTKLRQTVRRMVSESRLLDGIGNAQMVKELHSKVSAIAKDHSDTLAESGIDTSVSEEDARDYLELVLSELESARNKEKTRSEQ